MAYSADQMTHIQDKFSEIEAQYEGLFLKFQLLKLDREEAREYIVHGLMRRLGTLKHAIQKVFAIYPIERSHKPTKEELNDITINLQSIVINVFGCFDNLAWIWVKEKELKDKKGLPLSGVKVGLVSEKTHEVVRKTFSQGFQDYLLTLVKWFSYLEDYRHALAHRIPLYVPPFRITPDEAKVFQELENQKDAAIQLKDVKKYEELNTQQQALGKFDPIYVHSIIVGSDPKAFHPQMIADWLTVLEVAENFLKELA